MFHSRHVSHGGITIKHKIQHTSDQAIIPASNEKISIRTRTGQVESNDFTTRHDCSLLVLLTTTKAIPVWGNMGTKCRRPVMLKSASRLIITGRWKSDSTAEPLYTRLLVNRQHSVNIVWRKAINNRHNKELQKQSRVYSGDLLSVLVHMDLHSLRRSFVRFVQRRNYDNDQYITY